MDTTFEGLPRLLPLLGAGLLAGFINVLAGGGSLLTLPTLLFLGMPASVANATNRIGLVAQNVTATAIFHRRGRLDLGLTLRLALLAIPGAALGAIVALEVSDTLFRRILAGILLVALYGILRGSSGREERVLPIPHPWGLGLSFVAMGFYAGFIQAGLGFLLIAALTGLGGLDLIRSNAVKVAVVLLLQLLSLAIFQRAGQVDWTAGVVLAAGTMTGGWLGAHWQMRQGVRWVRRAVVVILLLFALRLLQQSF